MDTSILDSPRFKVAPALLNEIKSYLEVGPVPTIDWNDPESIRASQACLVSMEARLDRTMSIHHDAKRILQRLNQIVAAVRLEAMASGQINTKMSGPQVERELEAKVPAVFVTLRRWDLVAELCQDVQKRLETAKDTIKLMSRLDDNLRWAASRNL